MLDPLYHLAANAIVFFHGGFGPIFGDSSFFSWAFSVVLLVICVRILIFPLFVKQVKSQRTMQMMQPRIKEIREKWGHDKPRMQQEIMALQREHGNPLLGCLPIVLQIPLFISLFHVFTHLAPMNEGPNGSLVWRPRVGLSAHEVEQIASAKVFGISLSSSFRSNSQLVDFLGLNTTHVRILAVVLIVLMGLTTFMTQRQIMARTGPTDPQQAMVQKILLYGSPLMLAIFGFRFPIAVLLYWLTTNLWSMGQQFFVIKRMPPVQPLTASGRPAGPRTATDGSAAPARPAPGVRAGAKSKTRPRPATAAGPSLTKGSAPSADLAETPKAGARSASTAPAGTRSRSGAAVRPGGKAATEAGATGIAEQAAAGAPARSGGNRKDQTGKSAAARASDSGLSAAAEAGTADGAARPAPVSAGASRQPGGSRPTKRRGKGKRPGGRR
ncbi:membrane protein insertase YidC [Frankia sp. AgB32]|uniref:membrane protein insertase YidC n=1 Tax=Frankia sp. AgB32 TaxID=631119 RepID=UPI00200D497D|nr:membrane protein insertase YidC [Frankia sp. AgB32]MCK9895250.1 membrane protein insertase YidC [Frankia sp. AgB32]